jgi:hypothetical protein
MNNRVVQKMFEQRHFNAKEADTMGDLHTHAEFLAQRIALRVPSGEYQARALMKVRDAIYDCEMAFTLSPICDAQTEMPFMSRGENTVGVGGEAPKEDNKVNMLLRARELEKEAHELRELAAHARR